MKGGGYAGTLSVPLKIAPQAVPRSYRCALFIIFKDSDHSNMIEYRAPFRRAPGSPFLGEVSGTFAR